MPVVRELITKWGFNVDQRPLDRMEKSVGRLKKGIAAVAALSGAAALGLYKIAQSTAKAGDEAIKTARRAGMTAEAFQEMAHAANIGGVSQGQFAAVAGILARRMKDARDGIAESKDAFDELGISVTDAGGRLKPTDVILGEMAERFKDMPDGPLKTAIAMETMGRSGAQMINMLNTGADEMERLRREAWELGIVLDEDTLKQSELFVDEMTRAKMAIRGIKMIAGTYLIPIITKVATAFWKWVVANRAMLKPKIDRWLAIIVDFLGNVWSILTAVWKTTRTVVGWFGGLESVIRRVAYALAFLALVQAVTALISMKAVIISLIASYKALGSAALLANLKIMLVPIAIAAAIAALVLLIEDVVRFAQGGKSLTGELVEWFKKLEVGTKAVLTVLAVIAAINVVAFAPLLLLLIPIVIWTHLLVKYWHQLGDFFDDFWTKQKKGWQVIGRGIKNAFKSAFDFIVGQWNEHVQPIIDRAADSWIGGMLGLGGEEGAGGALDGVTPAGASPSPAGGTSNLNVNSTIEMQVPAGTPDEQVEALDQAARRAVREEWDAIARSAQAAFPTP